MSDSRQELDGWEFKVLRAMTGRFQDDAFLRAVLAEEARAGWDLVEKLSDHRLRLKRRVEWRDRSCEDGYRTWVDQGPVKTAIIVVCIALIVLALVLAWTTVIGTPS